MHSRNNYPDWSKHSKHNHSTSAMRSRGSRDEYYQCMWGQHSRGGGGGETTEVTCVCLQLMMLNVCHLSVLQRFYWSRVKFKTRSRPSTHVTMLWLARMSCPPPSPWYDCLLRQYDNAAVYWFVVSATINNNLQYPGSVSMLVWPQPKCIN